MKTSSLHGVTTAAVLSGLLVAGGCRVRSTSDDRPEIAPTPTPRTAATLLRRGIEVSAASGVVDWQRVAIAGLSFAVVRATDGGGADPSFAVNWRGLSATPLVRGAALAFDPDGDPGAQVRTYLELVELRSGDLVPVVEVEELGDATAGDVAERLQVVLDALEGRFGVPPIIATRAAEWDGSLPDTCGRYPLWVVDHRVQEPALPHGWDRWQLWEFRGASRFAGIEPPVDPSGVDQTVDDDESEESADQGHRVPLIRGNGDVDDLTRLLIL